MSDDEFSQWTGTDETSGRLRTVYIKYIKHIICFFGDRYSLSRPGWRQTRTQRSPVSASQVLDLKVWATLPGNKQILTKLLDNHLGSLCVSYILVWHQRLDYIKSVMRVSIKWFTSLKCWVNNSSLAVFLVKVAQEWLCLCPVSDFWLDRLCNRSTYLLSQPLCLVIQAARFAWLGFLPGRRHRPAMP